MRHNAMWGVTVGGAVLAGLLSIVCSVHAQDDKAAGKAAASYQTFASVAEAKTVCANFVNQVARGDVNQALDDLAAYWVLSDDEFDA
ncbi:MAG: hypothetical protein HYU33_00430, partial [Candidatus Omnitrophica bacterium]|nr:hypothetical protein [Candidatus Omnitrophota bacterium]